ncbi:MAG TPA: hypothetical protein VF173_25790 [Thermoanaerobaculia bacterium]|nr:hypothetical protein [Thermoanaerobaculia bacterium]
MKKQGQLPTLKLNRETLRHLEGQGLSRVQGGSGSCFQTCLPTCYNSCIEYNTCFCGTTTAA